MRRSELSALDVGDVAETGWGTADPGRAVEDWPPAGHWCHGRHHLRLEPADLPRCGPGGPGSTLPGSKTVPAFRNLRNGRVTGGRLTGDGIARMVKRRAKTAGVDYRPWRMILLRGSKNRWCGQGGPGHRAGGAARGRPA